MLLRRHLVVCASQTTHLAVAGAIYKPLRGQTDTTARARMLRDNRSNPVFSHFHLVNALLEEKGDLRLGTYYGQLSFVIVHVRWLGIPSGRSLLGHQFS